MDREFLCEIPQEQRILARNGRGGLWYYFFDLACLLFTRSKKGHD